MDRPKKTWTQSTNEEILEQKKKNVKLWNIQVQPLSLRAIIINNNYYYNEIHNTIKNLLLTPQHKKGQVVNGKRSERKNTVNTWRKFGHRENTKHHLKSTKGQMLSWTRNDR